MTVDFDVTTRKPWSASACAKANIVVVFPPAPTIATMSPYVAMSPSDVTDFSEECDAAGIGAI